MWVYRRSTGPDGEYEVGYFDPTKQWHHDSWHFSPTDAADRVHWLNGGSGDPHGIAEARDRACYDVGQNVGRYR